MAYQQNMNTQTIYTMNATNAKRQSSEVHYQPLHPNSDYIEQPQPKRSTNIINFTNQNGNYETTVVPSNPTSSNPTSSNTVSSIDFGIFKDLPNVEFEKLLETLFLGFVPTFGMQSHLIKKYNYTCDINERPSFIIRYINTKQKTVPGVKGIETDHQLINISLCKVFTEHVQMQTLWNEFKIKYQIEKTKIPSLFLMYFVDYYVKIGKITLDYVKELFISSVKKTIPSIMKNQNIAIQFLTFMIVRTGINHQSFYIRKYKDRLECMNKFINAINMLVSFEQYMCEIHKFERFKWYIDDEIKYINEKMQMANDFYKNGELIYSTKLFRTEVAVSDALLKLSN